MARRRRVNIWGGFKKVVSVARKAAVVVARNPVLSSLVSAIPVVGNISSIALKAVDAFSKKPAVSTVNDTPAEIPTVSAGITSQPQQFTPSNIVYTPAPYQTSKNDVNNNKLSDILLYIKELVRLKKGR